MGHISQMPLLELRSKYGLDLAIETGTQHCQGTLDLLKYFHWVYTIEIDPLRWSTAYIMLQEFAGARCLLGNSPDVLDIILKNPDKPNNILFWLDAHFPGDLFDKNDLNWNEKVALPLMEELKIILHHRGKLWLEKKCQDVIIIDDARIYKKADYQYGNWEHCYDNTDFLLPFYATHEVKLDLRETGAYILTPIQ